ncbi:MAG: hypothetical protein AB8I08_22515 [Sandaracinaceae bacterium]
MSSRHRRPAKALGRRRARREGYTIVEVVMAIGVLTAGAVGVMALQQAATRGNMSAREMTTGTQLAQRWIERLRRDRLAWTSGTTVTPVPPLLLTNTTYLRNVTPATAAPSWVTPVPPVASGESANFDFYGQDTTVAADMHYCTNMRLEWLYPGRAMRVDVRVWWVRRVTGSNIDTTAAGLSGCAAGQDPDDLTGDVRLTMAYASTVVRYVARRE